MDADELVRKVFGKVPPYPQGGAEGKAQRWRAQFMKEQVDAALVAAAFLAERYSIPEEDLTNLVYHRERDLFTDVGDRTGRPRIVGECALNEEIEEFMKARRDLPRWVQSWSVIYLLKGICHWWAEGTKLEGIGRRIAE